MATSQKSNKTFQLQSDSQAWWRGSFTIHYNLATVAKAILIVLGVALAGLLIWGLVEGAVWLAGVVWKALVALGRWIATNWLWLLIASLLALAAWLLSRVKWSNIHIDDKKAKKVAKPVGIGLLALAALFLLLSMFRGCEREEKVVEPQAVVTPERFNEAFDLVVTSRAYLDGVQGGESHNNRILVGLKFVNGQPVENLIFEGKTYEEAIEVVAADWRNLVVSNLGGQTLSEHQLVATILFAMRNGKYGFTESTFLEYVREGKLAEASKVMALHKNNGEKRTLGTEAQQYLWVIKNIYDGNLGAQELLDMPIWSYLRLDTKRMYDAKGNHLFNDELKAELRNGERETPRQALGL